MILGNDFIAHTGLNYEGRSGSVFFGQTFQPDCRQDWQKCVMTNKSLVLLPPQSISKVSIQAKVSPLQKAGGPGTCIASVATSQVPLASDEGLVTVSPTGQAEILIQNLSCSEVSLARGTFLGHLERISSSSICAVDLSSEPHASKPNISTMTKEKQEMLENMLQTQLATIPAAFRSQYRSLFLANHDIFSSSKHDIGKASVMSHAIHLKNEAPVYVPQFKIPESHRQVLLDHLNNWLKLGIVAPSTSRYNSPIFCVQKRDGSLRPVLDYRELNANSHIDKYSARLVSDCIDEIGRHKSKIFSSLDLTAGFWQMPLDKGSQSYTAFSIPGQGSFQWQRTPMGLLGSPASFGRMMEYIMKGLQAITYQDDILVHTTDHPSHLSMLEKVFQRLRANNLKLNLSKCQFGQTEVTYLGFRLTPKGILPGFDKTKAIRDFPQPSTVREVRAFVGLTSYFRQSVPRFSLLSQHLTNLTKKDTAWKGGPLPHSAAKAFEELKTALISPPVLAYPDPSRPYSLMVDASLGSEDLPGGLGACLMQHDDQDQPHPIAYASRGLSKHERNYSIYLLELTAAVFGITKFDTYLRDNHFTLYTDHRPLEKLSKTHTRTLNRLQQLMLTYAFTIVYKPGKENVVSDFLSRHPIDAVDISPDSLAEAQDADPLLSTLKRGLTAPSTLGQAERTQFNKCKGKLAMKGNVLFYTGRKNPAVFAPTSLRASIIQAAHNSLGGGHMGIFKTQERILASYYWPSMQTDIQHHIENCDICQRTRPYRRPAKVPLKPLPQPCNPNHRIHVDLFGPLIASDNQKRFILVITDSFTKYCELVAIENKEAQTVAQAIMDHWITRYSTPFEITSDQGKEFCNKLTQSLFSKLSVLHNTTSPYHPQANASAEVFNRTMRRYLQAFISPPFTDWESYLPALRFSYNTSINKATKASPFSLLFDMPPRMPFFEAERFIDYSGDLNVLTRLSQARQLAVEQNLQYKDNYKRQYDKYMRAGETEIQPGSQVLLEISQKKGKNPKLQPLFCGPYQVISVSETNATILVKGKPKVVHLNHVKPYHSQEEGEESEEELPQIPWATEPEDPATYPALPEGEEEEDTDSDDSFEDALGSPTTEYNLRPKPHRTPTPNKPRRRSRSPSPAREYSLRPRANRTPTLADQLLAPLPPKPALPARGKTTSMASRLMAPLPPIPTRGKASASPTGQLGRPDQSPQRETTSMASRLMAPLPPLPSGASASPASPSDRTDQSVTSQLLQRFRNLRSNTKAPDISLPNVPIESKWARKHK